MVMISLTMQEQDNPGISRVLPTRREFIKSRIAAFMATWSLLYLLICLGLLTYIISDSNARGVLVYSLIAAVVVLIYVIVIYIGIGLVKRHARRRYEELYRAQKRYIGDMDRLGELYADE